MCYHNVMDTAASLLSYEIIINFLHHVTHIALLPLVAVCWLPMGELCSYMVSVSHGQ